MKSNFIELHQDGESIFINTNNICTICIDGDPNGDTFIELTNGNEVIVDEPINQVIKCLE